MSMPPGSIGARAMVAVLDRSEITGARLAVFREHARSADVRAREAALDLLKAHDEIEGAAALLTEALLAKENGVAGTAAEVIADKPQRAGGEPPKKGRKGRKKKAHLDEEPPRLEPLPPSPALIKALLDALARPVVIEDPEIACVLADAAGALALKEAKPRLEELCRSPYPTSREHAQKALGLVGEKRACEPPPEGGPAPDELGHLARAPITLALETDAGAVTITLDPALAPVMVTRVADLARAGYYDGMLVHRVEPGFVTQFGAPFGDGSGGPDGKPAVRCETTPLPFVLGAVGIALDGRDTGSSQLFVMHASAPHLDGNYAIVGTATGPWAAFADGDVIRSVTVR